MAPKASRTPLVWSVNRGRDGWDIATDVPDELTTESLNVVLEKGALGRKRRGSASQTFTGDSFTGYNATFRFVPGQDDSAAEVFIVDTSGTTKILRVAAGTAASNLTLKDNVASNPHLVRAAVLNGKLYLAYDSTVNRLHVFDPTLSTTTVRRAGLATPAAPTVANTGAGTYAATIRYYRVAWRVKNGSTIQRQSLTGPSVSFTPSGTGTHARITQPSVPSEGETHWVIFGAEQITDPDTGGTDEGSYFELAEVAIATTTYDDNEVPTDYDVNNDPAPDEGTYTPFPSVKYLLSDGNRLIGLSPWETAQGDSLVPRAGRVYFGPSLDSTDADDDERISNTLDFIGYIDVQRNSGSEDRALAGPINGQVMVFQSRGLSFLAPTGNATVPYRRVHETSGVGAVSQESTFEGEDEAGRTAIYWCDPIRGPYRYGAMGLEWCGYDVQDVWATVNLAATTRVAAGVYDPELRACIFGIATGSSNTLSEFLVFFVREGRSTKTEGVRGGWVRWSENSATTFRSMAMLPASLGATMSRKLKPYFGDSTNLRRWNDDSSTQDGSTSFQAYVQSKAHDYGRLWHHKRISEAYLQASAQTGVTITQTFIRNFGDETNRTDTVLLTAAGSETRVIKKFEGSACADVKMLQVRLGDGSASTATWTLDEHIVTGEPLETA
jgi:hypothetical protein